MDTNHHRILSVPAKRRRDLTLEKMLLSDNYFAHRWLCHPGQECEGDGQSCQVAADPERLEFYRGLDEEGD